MAKQVKTYQELRAELDTVLLQLQQPDCDIEDAVKLYEHGLALSKQLAKHLQTAENNVQKLTDAEV